MHIGERRNSFSSEQVKSGFVEKAEHVRAEIGGNPQELPHGSVLRRGPGFGGWVGEGHGERVAAASVLSGESPLEQKAPGTGLPDHGSAKWGHDKTPKR